MAAPRVANYKKPPNPRPWCEHLVAHADVRALFHHLHDDCGVSSHWVLQGLAECIERFSFHNSYVWVRLMPVMARHHHDPETYDNTHTKGFEAHYLEVGSACFIHWVTLRFQVPAKRWPTAS